MAVRHTCDGCGAGGDAMTERGLFLKHEYCAACLPVVEAFMTARDLAHEAAADAYRASVDYAAEQAGLLALPDHDDA